MIHNHKRQGSSSCTILMASVLITFVDSGTLFEGQTPPEKSVRLSSNIQQETEVTPPDGKKKPFFSELFPSKYAMRTEPGDNAFKKSLTAPGNVVVFS